MAIGPVQLLVLGFKHPDFQGEIRVIDALGVRKDADGNVQTCTRASSAATSRPPSAP
jgi:hypothetical protein